MQELRDKTSPLGGIGVSIVVSALTLLVGLLGFGNALVRAKLFGTGVDMDSYIAVLAVPSVLMGLIPTMVVSVVVPSLMKVKGDSVNGKELRSTLLVLTALGSLFISSIGFFASGIFVHVLLPSGSATLVSNAVTISRLLWLATGLSLLSSFLVATLYSQSRFILPTLLSSLPAVFIIVFSLLFASKIGTRSIALGLLLGTGIQVGVLLPIWLSQGWRAAVVIGHPEIKTIIWRLPLMALSQLPFSAPPLIAAYWAARLPGGSLSYVDYSYSLAGFISVTISTGLAVVAFPKMAEDISAGAKVQVLADLERRLRLIFYVAVPAAALFVVLQEPILQFTLQRGRFDESSVRGIARILPWYLLGMVAIASLNLLRNLYYSMGEFGKTGLLGILITLLHGVLAGVLVNWLSYLGIGLAYGVASWVFLLVAMTWITGKRNGLWSKDLVQFCGKVILASFLVCLLALLSYSVFFVLPLLPRLALSTAFGGWAYVRICADFLHIGEYDELSGRLSLFIRKKHQELLKELKANEPADEKSL